MGTICTPPCANIFMTRFESKYIYSYIIQKVMTFLRLIDDLFMIWTVTGELLKFINKLNQKQNKQTNKQKIKFDLNFFKTKMF